MACALLQVPAVFPGVSAGGLTLLHVLAFDRFTLTTRFSSMSSMLLLSEMCRWTFLRHGGEETAHFGSVLSLA